MSQSVVTLFRGHKEPDYLSTKGVAPCFSEKRSSAAHYGRGNNDQSNTEVKDGYVTCVEFHGQITPIPAPVGLDLYTNVGVLLLLKEKYDAVKCKDGVIIVFNTSKLRNPTRELA